MSTARAAKRERRRRILVDDGLDRVGEQQIASDQAEHDRHVVGGNHLAGETIT